MKKRIEGVTVYGIDIGKNTFHVVGLDSTGKPTLHSKFRRDRLLVRFANTPDALMGMEGCPGSQWLARKHSACDSSSKDRLIESRNSQTYLACVRRHPEKVPYCRELPNPDSLDRNWPKCLEHGHIPRIQRQQIGQGKRAGLAVPLMEIWSLKARSAAGSWSSFWTGSIQCNANLARTAE
jgi:hypothetical protein